MENKFVVGIDPGTIKTGIGILHYPSGNYHHSLVIKMQQKIPIYHRTIAITRAIIEVLELLKHKGEIIAVGIEDQVVGKDKHAGLWLSKMTGMLAFGIHETFDVLPEWVHPSAVKKALKLPREREQALKKAIEWFEQNYLRTPETDDEAMAMGIAYVTFQRQVEKDAGQNKEKE